MITVDDFTVVLVDTEDSGQQVEYRSAARGRLAGFPAWEHVDRDLRHFIAEDIPNGTREEPYDDRDEAWHIVIFEEDGWVYVTENDASFRVRADDYARVWNALIDEFNPAEPFGE
ncbi:MAG TPA: hypothetical protein VF215_02745 [Thermoanaerobaculia bacterium]